MKKVTRLTESDLNRLVKKVLKENTQNDCLEILTKKGIKLPASCQVPVSSDQKINWQKCQQEVQGMVQKFPAEVASFLMCMLSQGSSMPKDFPGF